METRQIGDDTFFAFAHGIRMTLESLGLSFDVDTMQPILQRMDAILGNAKHSLIKGDDFVVDWDEFRHARSIEQQLCAEYLKKVNANAQITQDEASNDED